MVKVKEAIIVEGRYDRIKLSQLINGLIIDVGGFRIFKDKKKIDLIRTLAEKNGVLVLTDSDHAGFMIRNYITGSVQKGTVKHAYIPDIYGKEKRKNKFSKEGKLGVEGIPDNVLEDIIKNASSISQSDNLNIKKITKLDFYVDGLTGRDNSSQKRKSLLKCLSLPEHLSQNSLINVLNTIITYEQYREVIKKI